MAKKRVQSKLSSKLGKAVVQAFEAHKADEVDYGRTFADLPGTIKNGVAKLVECKIGVIGKGDNTGEYYLSCRGVIVDPETTPSDDGESEVKVKGRQTSIFQGLHDTKSRTVDENVATALNHLKLLGAELDGVEADDLEDVCTELVKEAPYFRFSTKRNEGADSTPTNPKFYLNEYWNGACEYDEDEDTDDVVDGEAEEPEEEEEGEEEEADGEDNLAELGEAAEAGDGEAQSKLEDLATAAGLDVESLETWQDVAEALTEADGGEADEAEEAEEVVPAKNDIYQYTPKGKKKSIECVVTMTFAKNKTCNLKGLDDGKLHKAVPWSALSAE